MATSDIAIRVEGLGKQYRIGKLERYRTLRDSLTETVAAPFRRARQMVRSISSGSAGAKAESPSETIWALKDVSFEVPRGAVVGVIGRNGAGKSTLLKVLSRITEPTEGHVEIRGRVGSLLEVGTGFHGELSGRENIYLNGAILGMRRAEIVRKFDEIVAFAEVDKFIDTPVKHYSSGMYMRLAFAVAAHLEPEILIVDEVLAVGDAQFQKKCLGKMGDVAREGRTVLFVSHNMAAVGQLTRLCLVLKEGTLRFQGETQEAMRHYLSDEEDANIAIYRVGKHGRRLNGYPYALEFLSFELREHNDGALKSDSDVVIWITVRAKERVPSFRLSAVIYKSDGAPVGGTFGLDSLSIEMNEVATFEFRLKGTRLAPGAYVCGFGVGKGRPEIGHSEFDVVLDVVHFRVLPLDGAHGTATTWESAWGAVRLPIPECDKLAIAINDFVLAGSKTK